MKTHYDDQRDVLTQRLQRIEGQVRGVQRMIDENRYCMDVVHQITALSAAAREVAVILVETHLRACAAEAVDEAKREEMITEMTAVFSKVLRP